MDSLDVSAAALPMLGRMHDLLAGVDVGAAADRATPFANYVDPVGLVDATRVGTDRIRSWRTTTEEAALAEAADRLRGEPRRAHEPFTARRANWFTATTGTTTSFPRNGKWSWSVTSISWVSAFASTTSALTLFFTVTSLPRRVDLAAWRELAALVSGYDTGTAVHSHRRSGPPCRWPSRASRCGRSPCGPRTSNDRPHRGQDLRGHLARFGTGSRSSRRSISTRPSAGRELPVEACGSRAGYAGVSASSRPMRRSCGVAEPSVNSILLDPQEVAVDRVVDVDADAAVDVQRGVRDAAAALGRPELRGRDLERDVAALVEVRRGLQHRELDAPGCR